MDSHREDEGDDVAALLSELQTTLTRLQSELDAEARPRGGTERREPQRPRPPSFGELLRFTDEYTIPTLIAVLEATIQSLQLLRGTLRLADPERALGARGDDSTRRAGDARRRVTAGVETALSELQTALSETEFPADPEARRLLRDARELSAEVERAIGDAGAQRDDRAEGPASAHGQTDRVTIPVTEEAATENESADAEDPAVDVDAELASIKDEIEESDRTDDRDYDD